MPYWKLPIRIVGRAPSPMAENSPCTKSLRSKPLRLSARVKGGLERRSEDYRTTPDIDRRRRGGRALTQ